MRGFKRRLIGVLRTFGPVEAVMALFFASALWLPPLAGNQAYLPALALLGVYACYETIRERRLPLIPLFFVAYLAVFALATIHGGNFDLASFKQGYVVRPLTALAIGAIVTTARQRMNVLILIVLFAISQVPITAAQVLENVVRYGRHATHTDAVDQVTGSLATSQEPHQGSVLTFVAMIGIAIVVSSWLWGRLRTAIALVLCLTLGAIGAFAATRAAPLFVLVLGVALVGAALSLGRWRPPKQRVVAVGIASVAAAAAVSGLSVALYADLYSGINKERLGGTGGAVDHTVAHSPRKASLASVTVTLDATLVAGRPRVAAGKEPRVEVSWSGVIHPSAHDWIGVYRPGAPNAGYIDWIYDSSCTRTAGDEARGFGSCSFAMNVSPGAYELRLFPNDTFIPLASSGTFVVEQTFQPAPQLLPGRIAQLELAVRLSVRDGPATALIGRGPGSSEPAKRQYPDKHSIPPPERTGSTWLGRLLTETGWLGVAAFFALLAWLALLGRRLCRSDEATEDRVLGVALIGVAALTGAIAAYGTFPTLSGYAVLFWAMVGLGISAARDRRHWAKGAAVTDGEDSGPADGQQQPRSRPRQTSRPDLTATRRNPSAE